MKITLLEPFCAGSHEAWAKEYSQFSKHDIEILSLSGNFWKWRMHGGAVTLSKLFLNSDITTDLLLATDMLDLTTFLALTRTKTAHMPVVIYFHESQICYPWSPKDSDIRYNRDQHYGFINYSSALAADKVVFNSWYHHDTFLNELPRFLKQFPDRNEIETVRNIQEKSCVLHLGLDLKKFDKYEKLDQMTNRPPLILWNHRWEYDKNPDDFFKALYRLQDRGLDFRVAILGKNFTKKNSTFEIAREKLGNKVVHYGFADSFTDYAKWLYCADILPVTSNHDFFGASIVEALYCGCYPLLPKRLTYPELIGYDNYPDVFYNDLNQLIEKLANLIQDIANIREKNFRHCIGQYSWENMVQEYDKKLSDIARHKKNNKK